MEYRELMAAGNKPKEPAQHTGPKWEQELEGESRGAEEGAKRGSREGAEREQRGTTRSYTGNRERESTPGREQ